MSQLELGGPNAACARRRARPAVDGDEPDPRLDQAARQEQVLSQGMHAITLRTRRRLLIQLERLAAAPSVGQLERVGVELLPIFFCATSAVGAFGRIEAVQQTPPRVHAHGRHRGKQFIGRPETGHGRVIACRADEQRAVIHAQVASRADIRRAKHGIADALNQPDVGRDAALGRSNLGQDGTDVGRVGRRTACPLRQ